jgi:tRNA A-37 threonylcarbamoyl transferase component Bud32
MVRLATPINPAGQWISLTPANGTHDQSRIKKCKSRDIFRRFGPILSGQISGGPRQGASDGGIRVPVNAMNNQEKSGINHPGGDPDATLRGSAAEQTTEVAALLEQYLAGLEAGKKPDRAQLLAEHPHLAEPLGQALAGIEFIHQVTQQNAATPSRLGDFRIIREVGRGGMGVVYEAEQISLNRRVALKVLRFGAVADEVAMGRFQREAETVARMHHTNIVPIFAVGSEEGVRYYAMQFIEGRDLSVRIREARDGESEISPGQLAGWGLQAAEALAHAHQRGVIHRDIKPSNLILDQDGRIWLTDFGLARRADDATLSVAGALLGTPRYMSPEQARATTNPVDHRTDIYSLGATLYELATRRPIFEAAHPHAVITQILNDEPLAPRRLAPELPRDLDTIILKCLAKDPGRRYASAQALADDLRAFLAGRPISARLPSLPERAARWAKKIAAPAPWPRFPPDWLFSWWPAVGWGGSSTSVPGWENSS